MLVAADAAVCDNVLGRQPQPMSLVDSIWCPSEPEMNVRNQFYCVNLRASWGSGRGRVRGRNGFVMTQIVGGSKVDSQELRVPESHRRKVSSAFLLCVCCVHSDSIITTFLIRSVHPHSVSSL